MAICAHAACDRQITEWSKTGVCRDHVHTDNCRCVTCTVGKPTYRVKTISEMVSEGLLRPTNADR